MDALDAQQQLVWDAEIAVAVLGRAGEFVLVPLTESGPIPEAVTEAASERNLRWMGVLCVVNGQAVANSELDSDSLYTMMHAGLAFAHQVADRLRPQQQRQGDAVEWLERLWTLRDMREN